MPNCQTIEPLVTPYVDGQLTDPDRRAVDEHLRVCSPCHSRVAAERAVHDLLQQRREALVGRCAPESLHAKCRSIAASCSAPAPRSRAAEDSDPAISHTWRSRLAPLALAASLVLVVAGAFLYQLTASSSRVMAAELAADHMKCFAMSNVLKLAQGPSAVESAMLSGFGWRMHLPAGASQAGLELVGSRPCVYAEGKVAHIMYRHNGEPVSLFMVPETSRAQELVEVLGHKAAIWCDGKRTFVLVAREPKDEVARLAAVVQGSMK